MPDEENQRSISSLNYQELIRMALSTGIYGIFASAAIAAW